MTIIIYYCTIIAIFSRYFGNSLPITKQILIGRKCLMTQVENIDLPRSFIVVNNLQSGSNIGSICRNALAFNAQEIVTVGRKGFPSMHHADKGSRFKMKFTHFLTTKEASVYLKEVNNCTVFGVEITSDSIPVTKYPFSKSSAFVFGNEGGGLSKSQREICDQFIYIPQYSSGMASINVACASAIIMHSFAIWAKFPESEIVGEKFV